MQALVPETDDEIKTVTNLSKVHSLKAAIFHTKAYKLSLEINKNKMTHKTLIAFLKVLYNVSQIKKKRITFEQYSRIHLTGPKIAVCETVPNVIFVLNLAFTTKDHSFQAALQEATMAFISMLQDFGYTQQLNVTIPTHTKFTLHNNILYSEPNNSTHLVSLFDYISRLFLHLY